MCIRDSPRGIWLQVILTTPWIGTCVNLICYQVTVLLTAVSPGSLCWWNPPPSRFTVACCLLVPCAGGTSPPPRKPGSLWQFSSSWLPSVHHVAWALCQQQKDHGNNHSIFSCESAQVRKALYLCMLVFVYLHILTQLRNYSRVNYQLATLLKIMCFLYCVCKTSLLFVRWQ